MKIDVLENQEHFLSNKEKIKNALTRTDVVAFDIFDNETFMKNNAPQIAAKISKFSSPVALSIMHKKLIKIKNTANPDKIIVNNFTFFPNIV